MGWQLNEPGSYRVMYEKASFSVRVTGQEQLAYPSISVTHSHTIPLHGVAAPLPLLQFRLMSFIGLHRSTCSWYPSTLLDAEMLEWWNWQRTTDATPLQARVLLPSPLYRFLVRSFHDLPMLPTDAADAALIMIPNSTLLNNRMASEY